jgi:hypothetical protein
MLREAESLAHERLTTKDLCNFLTIKYARCKNNRAHGVPHLSRPMRKVGDVNLDQQPETPRAGSMSATACYRQLSSLWSTPLALDTNLEITHPSRNHHAEPRRRKMPKVTQSPAFPLAVGMSDRYLIPIEAG